MHTDDGNGLFDCRPVLCVDNVARSIQYYVEALGFHLGWAWSAAKQQFLPLTEFEAADFALVGRGKVQFMLSEKSQGVPGMWLHLDVESAAQLDALNAEWARNGAQIIEPPFVRPWGMYEMRIQDLDGHVFRVSSPPHPKAN